MKSHKPRLVVEFFASITLATAWRFVSQVAPRIEAASELIILINSTGGSVKLSYALTQFIAKLEGPVITYNVGMCASAAVMIFAAGQERVAQKYSVFYVHEVATKGTNGVMPQSHDIDAWNQKVARCLHLKTGRDVTSWREDMAKKRHFNSSEAIRIGLASRINHFRRRYSDIVVSITN